MKHLLSIDRTGLPFALCRQLALVGLAFLSTPALWAQVMPQNFISVTPCRIADTRTASGGPGPLTAGTYKNFTVAGLATFRAAPPPFRST